MRFSLYLNWLPTELEYLHYIRLLKSGNRDGLLEWRPDWTPLFDFVNTTDSLTKDTVRWEFKQNYGKFRIKRIPNFFKDFNNNDIVNDNYQSKDGTLFDNNNFDGNSALFICCRLNCDLTFAQEFDLSHFPFDCQDLSLLRLIIFFFFCIYFVMSLRVPFFVLLFLFLFFRFIFLFGLHK